MCIEEEIYAQDFQLYPVPDHPPGVPVGWWDFGWCFPCLFHTGGSCRKGTKSPGLRCLRWSLSCSTPCYSTPFLAYGVTSDPLLFQRAGAANPHRLGGEGESCQLCHHGCGILITPAGEGRFFEETSEQVRAKQVASTHWSLLLAQRWELCKMPSCWSFYFVGSDIFPPPHCTAKHLFKGPFPLLWHSAQQLWLIKGTACARENGGSSR